MEPTLEILLPTFIIAAVLFGLFYYVHVAPHIIRVKSDGYIYYQARTQATIEDLGGNDRFFAYESSGKIVRMHWDTHEWQVRRPVYHHKGRPTTKWVPLEEEHVQVAKNYAQRGKRIELKLGWNHIK